jgi:hypothetical protein|tara:strand:+ start:374 stop:547 length:174 start_codon:yes stop_codon:yes gene_type:complete
MGLFSFLKRKTPKQKLSEKYEKLLKESFDLSKIDRVKSDEKMVEAQNVANEIDKLSD